MKTFREKMSITKLVFLILTIVLSFQTIWYTVYGITDDLFQNVMLMVVSFYFWQKIKLDKNIDSLLDKNNKDE